MAVIKINPTPAGPGKWEACREYPGFLRCSRCKDVYISSEWLADGKWNFCPNCGAPMDASHREGHDPPLQRFKELE